MKHFISVGLLCVILGITGVSAESVNENWEGNEPVSSDSLLIAYLQENGVKTTPHNEVLLLPSGKEKFEVLFQDIARAKHHIHLEYFNFRNDSIAAALFTVLAQKAREGVKVRAMFDDFGNWSNNRPLRDTHLKELAERGIEIVRFDPIRFPYVNHVAQRDHRKIVVIDGKIAYTGGMNIADYYIKGLPDIGPWRDMHLRLEGESVRDLQRIFLTMWNKTTRQQIEGNAEMFPTLPDSLSCGGEKVAIVDRIPKKLPKLLRRTLAYAIASARDSIVIINPYFLPTHLVRNELKDALKRGVKVKIMISSKADIPFTPEGSIYVVHNLMKRGAEVYLFNGGFHHSKIMMIDGIYCTVGSANLNSRSLRYDYEVNTFIFDKGTTAKLDDLFNTDTKHSTLFTPEVWKSLSRWKRFVGWCANLFTPFM